MIYATRAIALNHLRYGDNSLIVHLYTESMGRQTVFAKGALGKKSQLRAAFFQPLHLLETHLHHRENRQMQRLSNVSLHIPFQNIPFDPVKNAIAMFIAEVLHKTLKEEEPNPAMFDFLLHAIQTLDLNERGTANFHLVFLVRYSRYLGFFPNTEQSSDSAWFDAQKGRFVSAPAHSSPPSEYNSLLRRLFDMSFNDLDRLKINRDQRNWLAEYLLNYYSTHFVNFGKLTSHGVLRSVFGE